MSESSFSGLVSVIIPCYNQDQYLAEAIESVLKQTYPFHEVIVIDDGSTDESKTVARSYTAVRYVHQKNSGLSVARNTGIRHSKGQFLVFLDADDWFFPDALQINLRYLQKDETIAFVSGAHQKINNAGQFLKGGRWRIQSNHYQQLLQKNYIGMHATVMFRRWVFDVFQYDVTLKACEDYDLYLNITRKYPVVHHEEPLAAYRIHASNMSADIPLMLTTVLAVLGRQETCLQNKTEKKCYNKGQKIWKKYYCKELFKALLHKPLSLVIRQKKELATLKKYRPGLYFRLLCTKAVTVIKSRLRHLLVPPTHPATGKVQMGDFDRIFPFSRQFGYDRGGPVDRYYIENFLEQHQEEIKGNVLEIGDNDYTLRYGGARIGQSDILHVDKKNPKATYVGDLSNAPELQDNYFDCIILTQTLHLIYDFKAALQTCYRILKPGGVLLLTVPGISHIDQGEWRETWLWSFTGTSVTKIFSEIFPRQNIKVETHGNVLVAAAFLYGMGLPELKREQLDYHDPHYQVIVTGFAKKPE